MRLLILLVGVVFLTLPAPAAELSAETLSLWDRYIEAADRQAHDRLRAGRHFLWADEAPGRVQRLRAGEILIAPVAGSGIRRVPRGLIHHWLGAIFLPGATLPEVLAITHDYERYKQIYYPKVMDSQLLSREEHSQKYTLLFVNNLLFVSAALRNQYESRDFPVDSTRWYQISHTTSVQEVESYGRPHQRLLPPGKGRGFLWRLESIARYEQRDGGVYMELEALGLSRDIPVSLRWLTRSLVSRLSRSTLEATLRQTRDEAMARCHNLTRRGHTPWQFGPRNGEKEPPPRKLVCWNLERSHPWRPARLLPIEPR